MNGVIHNYTTLSDKIVREVYGTTTIDYLYDNDGRPYKLIIDENGTTYTGYFVLNLQGDVIAIIDQNGTVAVQYKYDAWGKEVSHTTGGSYGSKLYGYNALKYRGYYYDAETGFYYVSSRYYDPEVGRFISADTTDVLTASPSALTDKNLYAYCDNNPVMRKDTGGAFWETAIDVVSLCVSVAEVMANPADPWEWAGLAGDAIDLVPFVTGVGELTKVAKVTVKAVDNSDDVIKATRNLARSSGIKKFTGSYEIMFESGTNYVGKGGLYRSTVSAKFRSVVNNDRVTSISWTPSSSTRNAYISEYNMMKKNGVKNSNTYNKIWSPGRSILQSIWTNLFGR